MPKTGFVYIWYDRKRKMYYVGCHMGAENDGYICSSNRMRDAYRRRPKDFKRRILKRDIQKEDILSEEYKWLKLINDNELGVKYYNASNRQFGHWRMSLPDGTPGSRLGKKHTEETKAKMRGRIVSATTKQKLREAALKQFSDPENRRKAGEANVGNSNRTGTKHTEETKMKMSVKARNRSSESIERMRQTLTGRKHTEETKAKMRGPRPHTCKEYRI